MGELWVAGQYSAGGQVEQPVAWVRRRLVTVYLRRGWVGWRVVECYGPLRRRYWCWSAARAWDLFEVACDRAREFADFWGERELRVVSHTG